MSTIMSTPAASRIAQIRSALGQSGRTGDNGAFALQLDTFRSQNAAPQTTFTVGSSTTVPTVAADNSATAPTTAAPMTAAPMTAAPTTAAPTTTAPTAVLDSVPYAALFNEAGARYDVDPALLASVAKVESAFDPTAISSAGAQGLMQFMPATAAEMGVDSFDPASAVDGAARYLRRELDRFGSVELALAAYNAGPGAVQRHGGVPPFAETQRYVEKVLTALESHQPTESDR